MFTIQTLQNNDRMSTQDLLQAISAAVNTTRNKISHGLILSFSIILLYRYSSINLYYSTQPA